jgi:2,4-dienoyl-CoA reductase-like NADH-dependent reductase (Old Yellow Enzyme family)
LKLFSPYRVREVELKNRIVVSPMCEYSAKDGHPQPWHMVHLGSRAVGGAADTGIYEDAHVESWRPIARFIREQGAIPGMQLAHAGRKASTGVPWTGGKPVKIEAGGWEPVGPSALAFDQGYNLPHALTGAEIDDLVVAFRRAAERALGAGFEVIEIHGAHGYLLHQFLSPLCNQRTDEYGGSLENRMRLAVRVAKVVRHVWPERLPLFFRVSASDWAEGGWDLAQTIELARELKSLGVDLIDASSGGAVPHAKISIGPGYQVEFAAAIRREAGIATGAVGMITGAAQAETILATGQADLVFLARAMLRDPYWSRSAAAELGVKIAAPEQYQRAW